jgi:DENN domain-containing protein 5
MECPRIADYFLVIGTPFDSLIPLPTHDQLVLTNDPLKLAYTPSILDRYPLTDHSDVTFPTGLTLFCLPDGLHLVASPKPPIFFSFVQTSDNGSQLIGCCLTFYEELNSSQRQQLNYYLDHNEGSDASSEAMKSIKFYLPKCLCLLSHWPFVSSFKKFLCHIYRLSLSPCTIPLERYISNFLNDVPAPPPGKVEVTYIIGPDSVVFGRPPSNEPTAWSSHPLSSLFECLSLQNILTIFSALISERQVALISSQYSLLTTCSESILSLLFPLTWTHVYIPILPRRILGLSLSLSLSSFHSLRSLGCSATFPCRSALLLPPRLLSRVLLYGASEQKSKLHGIHPKPVRRLCCLLFRNCSRLSG